MLFGGFINTYMCVFAWTVPRKRFRKIVLKEFISWVWLRQFIQWKKDRWKVKRMLLLFWFTLFNWDSFVKASVANSPMSANLYIFHYKFPSALHIERCCNMSDPKLMHITINLNCSYKWKSGHNSYWVKASQKSIRFFKMHCLNTIVNLKWTQKTGKYVSSFNILVDFVKMFPAWSI